MTRIRKPTQKELDGLPWHLALIAGIGSQGEHPWSLKRFRAWEAAELADKNTAQAKENQGARQKNKSSRK